VRTLPFLSHGLLLLASLAVLLLGMSVARADTPPACHEMAVHHGSGAGNVHRPEKGPDRTIPKMACCVACTTAIPPGSPVRERLRTATTRPVARILTLPTGRYLAPEPGPPR